MSKTDQVSWVKRIHRLLVQAKRKDAGQAVFGANSHKYELAPPAGEDAVQAFEEKHNIRLPEEYRDFLTLAGDGGAGPYYGVYGLRELEREITDDCYRLQDTPVIYPGMSDEEWDLAADPEDERDEEELYPFAGILPIGSQGCTYMTGLMLHGPYCGQVVYFDLDCCSKPFFVREQGFLAWYERWLREVIAGYEISWFGTNLDGDAQELMEQYEQTDDRAKKLEIIASCYKFQKLPKKQQKYFKGECDQEADMEVRMRLVKMLVHFQVKGMAGQIDKLWEQGAYAEAVSVITYEGGREEKEKWYRPILEKLPELKGDAFRDACYTIKALKDHPDVSAGMLKAALGRNSLDRNERAVLFYCIGELRGREEVLDHFLDYLMREEDAFLMLTAVQALRGIGEPRLTEVYVELLDRYRANENVLEDYRRSLGAAKSGNWLAANSSEGQLVNNLILGLDSFGQASRGSAWKLLMSDEEWERWKRQYFL